MILPCHRQLAIIDSAMKGYACIFLKLNERDNLRKKI